MKNSESASLGNTVPSLFQIAAFFEDFFPAEGRAGAAASLPQLPFAGYMLNPEKLVAMLRSGKSQGGTATAPAKGQNQAKRGGRPTSKKATDPGSGNWNGSDHPLPEPPKKIEFSFHSPLAHSVKLAGDFTEWEAHAIEMMHSQDGVWFTVVPLAPGAYSYRFIVDGRWCDDPRVDRRVPNPFGTQNAIIHVS